MIASSVASHVITEFDDIVERLVETHDIEVGEVDMAYGWDARAYGIALAEAKTLGASFLGEIVFAFPTADLYGMHGGAWLDRNDSGPFLLQQIVATIMVARMRVIQGGVFPVGYFDARHGGTD